VFVEESNYRLLDDEISFCQIVISDSTIGTINDNPKKLVCEETDRGCFLI